MVFTDKAAYRSLSEQPLVVQCLMKKQAIRSRHPPSFPGPFRGGYHSQRRVGLPCPHPTFKIPLYLLTMILRTRRNTPPKQRNIPAGRTGCGFQASHRQKPFARWPNHPWINKLNTVCGEGRGAPNMGECWGAGHGYFYDSGRCNVPVHAGSVCH